MEFGASRIKSRLAIHQVTSVHFASLELARHGVADALDADEDRRHLARRDLVRRAGLDRRDEHLELGHGRRVAERPRALADVHEAAELDVGPALGLHRADAGRRLACAMAARLSSARRARSSAPRSRRRRAGAACKA